MQIQHVRDLCAVPGAAAELNCTGDILSVQNLLPQLAAPENKPHQCQQCLKSFSSNHQLHLRNHDAQVERAKSRPFHCNLCGKGFATESSLRTHTSKVGSRRSAFTQKSDINRVPLRSLQQELQLHLGVLQQHAALISNSNSVTCNVCSKIFLGVEALNEHIKYTHKEVAVKRRVANHPCPMCGKHYVNEGCLRKHLLTHPRTPTFRSNLQMWPCSVCQAVFTHESGMCRAQRKHRTISTNQRTLILGLITHIEHMKMDPKHQFAAQYMFTKAVVEQREKESGGGGGGGGSSMVGMGGVPGLPSSMVTVKELTHNSISPLNYSENSSTMGSEKNGESTGGGGGAGTGVGGNGAGGGNGGSSVVGATGSVFDNHRMPNHPHGGLPFGGSGGTNGGGSVGGNGGALGGTNGSGTNGVGGGGGGGGGGICAGGSALDNNNSQFSRMMMIQEPKFEPDLMLNEGTPSAVQAAVVNLATAMRIGQTFKTNTMHGGDLHGGNANLGPLKKKSNMLSFNDSKYSLANRQKYPVASTESSIGQNHCPATSETAIRIQQAEAILRSQAEAALRLAVSQAQAVVSSNAGIGSGAGGGAVGGNGIGGSGGPGGPVGVQLGGMLGHHNPHALVTGRSCNEDARTGPNDSTNCGQFDPTGEHLRAAMREHQAQQQANDDCHPFAHSPVPRNGLDLTDEFLKSENVLKG
uniref:C2H2-type domain-containing protein n=1 Tax=Anopheles maculatus TaxID=74869 RepID=A0A182SD75_9DIPT